MRRRIASSISLLYPPEKKPLFLGPFQYATSTKESHKVAIAQAIRAAMVFVADSDGEIARVFEGERRQTSKFVCAGRSSSPGSGTAVGASARASVQTAGIGRDQGTSDAVCLQNEVRRFLRIFDGARK